MGLPPPPGLPPCRAALTVAGLGPSWREAAASATATAAYMAANTRPNLGTTVATNLKSATNNGGAVSASLDHASVFATASVGRGDWASEVLQNVVGGETTEETAAPVTSPPTAPPPAPPPLSAEEQLRQVLLQKKRLFHSNRCLELKNLPEGVTEQDIRAAFCDLELTSVAIDRNDGRWRAGARLTLTKPELLDDWPKSRENVFVRNKEVSVCVGSSDQWLCVARLPPSLSEEAFVNLASNYGKVRSAFLMVSESTGRSKGYGLIKYLSNEAAAQARQLMDNRDLEGFCLQVDWLNSTHISLKQLHSKCLYVDHLPQKFAQGYRDMATYRKVFSVVKNPPYCQIAMRNGVIQDWGLVEFFDAQEAEQTQERMNGYNLGGRNIRVHYCIPGINAINIHMKVVNSPMEGTGKKKALLEDAPSSNVYSQLQKLTSQNPVFAQNLQNIIQTQIATIQTGSPPAPDRRPSPQAAAQGAAPSPGVETQQSIDASAQAALMILLTAERQAAAGEPSILHNPEVVAVLQSLVCQEEGRREAIDPYAQIMNIPGMTVALGSQQQQQFPAPPQSSTPPMSSTSPPPIIANNLNLLSNTASLNQLLGVISKPPTATSQATPPPPPPTTSQQAPNLQELPPAVSLPSLSQPPPPRPALLAHPPPPPPTSQAPPPPPPTHHQLQPPQPQLVPQAHHQQLLQAQLAAAQQLQQLQVQQLQAQQLAQLYPMQAPMMAAQYQGFLMPPTLAAQQQPQLYHLTPQLQLQQQQQQQIQQQLGLHQLGLLPLPALQCATEATASPLRSPASSVGGSVYTSPSPGGLKRKASIPASPEDSPQGPYIGQHSQGLGGHYADSYWQKKRLKHHF